MAHAAMLGHCGILTPTEAAALQDGLAGILSDLDEGALTIDPAAEDIHMFVEQTLTKRLGDVGRSSTLRARATIRWRSTCGSICSTRSGRSAR